MNESIWARQLAGRTDETAMGSKAGTMRHALIGVGVGLALALGAMGCHKTAQQASNASVDQNGGDPADANLASGNGTGQQPVQVLGERAQNQNQQQGEDYSQQQGAPIVRQAPDASQSTANQPSTNVGTSDAGDQLSQQQAEALYAADLSDAEANDPPPPLPDYEQPPAPEPDYLWTPGYWAWSPAGYYWVPGGWVAAPYAGALWTPGYWGFFGGRYRFHHGYWGPHIGYYGGVDYGYGYVGHGYYGGYWNHDHFFYNTTISRVNVVVIHNVYVHPVVVNNVIITGRIGNRVSFNGGRGGIVAQPLPAEVRVLHEQRIPPMATQVRAQHEAVQNRQQFFNQNGGRPAIVVAARPVAADRVLPAELPRATSSFAPAGHGEARPGQMQPLGGHPLSQPQIIGQPGRSAPGSYEARPGEQNRIQPQGRPEQQPQSQTRPGQFQTQPQQGRSEQPQSQMRQGQQQPETRPEQPQQQPQARPIQVQPQPQQWQERQGQSQSQIRPLQQQPEVRQAQPQSQLQTRPQPVQAPAAHPQPQVKPKEEEKH
jgi:hypothetical protein